MTTLSQAQDQHPHDGNALRPRSPGTGSSAADEAAVLTMLEARSVALVGASPRAASFGRRMLEEVGKSGARPRIYPVNPRYADLDGRRCYPSLADLPEAPDLALLAVPDAALEQQLSLAAGIGCARRGHIRQRARDPAGCAGAPGGRAGAPGSWCPARRREPGGLAAGTAGRDRARRRDGVVRARLHGLRQRQLRLARDRLYRARSAADWTGRTHHALGLGILRAAARPARFRVHAGRLLWAGTRDGGARLPGLRARPARHQGASAGAGGDPRRGRASAGAGSCRQPGHSRRTADRWQLSWRPRDGRGALGRARGLGRRLGGACQGARGPPRARSGRVRRHH